MDSKRSCFGTLELMLAMVISGSIGVFVIKSGQQPANVVFFRCACAFLCLVPYCYWRGYLRAKYFKVNILLPVVIAGVLMVINWVLLFKAFPVTTISLATIVYHVNPFVVMLLSVVFLRQSITRNDIAWSVLAFVGLLLAMSNNGKFILPGYSERMGLLLVLCATTLYAGTVILTKLTGDTPPALIVMIQTLVGVFILFPFADFSALPGSAVEWEFIVALGVVHTFVLYCLVFSAYQKLDISVIAIMSFIYPVSAVVFDYLFFDYVITYWQVAGAALIFLGTVGIKLAWKIIPATTRKKNTRGE